MKYFDKLQKKLKWMLVQSLLRYGDVLSDKIYTKMVYRLMTGKKLNLNNPQTFNEKLQWLKLYDHNPLYTTLVDKYAVKQWVADKIGSEYVIPTLGVWDRPEDIDWDSLPDQFVLKTTHGGGGDGVVICKDKAKLNKAEVLARLQKSMKTDPYKRLREWPYKNVPRRIIAEKFMQDYGRPDIKDLVDYKFFCFDGKPYYCQVIRDRHSSETIDFYDMKWNLMPFVGVNPNVKNGNTPVERPTGFDSMVKICERLSKDLSFSRIDLYEINDAEYFGEVTFFPGGAVGHFSPDEWNYRLGDLVKLEGTNGGGYKCLIQSDLNIAIERIPMKEGINDYKFFCYDGKAKYFKVDYDRFVGHRANYYSFEGELLPFGEAACPPLPDHIEEMPENLQEMVSIAERISTGKPFLRVDLYNINGRIYFGETTFYPAGGVGKLIPQGTDECWGKWIRLTSSTGGGKLLIYNEMIVGVSGAKLTEGINDYKFFCFDGEVKYLFVATDRNKTGEEVKFDYFDADFNHLDLRQQHPMSGKEIQKPQTFEEMKRVASLLSKGFPEVRCDLYEINGKVYFGEMTFFHHGGVTPFHPESWDYEWGGCIKLPINN